MDEKGAFHRSDPITGAIIEVQVLEITQGPHYWDDYREVRLRFKDGRLLSTTCWRDPKERGTHWCEEQGMVIVPELTTEHCLAAVDSILHQGAVEEAFEPVL